tara:strand:+ start:201 stop:389 length:189 start_codon:yes stop_codon:yes gene_type:complete
MNSSLQYITNDQGEKTGVVLQIFSYEKLMEDVRDLATIAERRDEGTIPHEEFIAELRKDAIL